MGLASVFYLLWLFSGASFLKPLGKLATVAAFLLALWTSFIWIQEKQENKDTFIQALPLAASLFMSWNYFKHLNQGAIVTKGKSGTVLYIKNTSEKDYPLIQVEYGGQKLEIKDLKAREEREMGIALIKETQLKALIPNKDYAQETQFAVSPKNRTIFLRIDPMGNLLPEVK